jgi:hypothetical protein
VFTNLPGKIVNQLPSGVVDQVVVNVLPFGHVFSIVYMISLLPMFGSLLEAGTLTTRYFHLKYFASERASIEQHVENKYILIVDGNCIASAHQWVFGSGSVPIMITHPDNNYWFKDYLKPMVHYVPIAYDLSDLQEKIQWLADHDEEAEQIAKNAMLFANTHFTPEFQRAYVDKEINRILNGDGSMLRSRYESKCQIPCDINEHLPTLLKYAKKCDSVTECGVCNIVSSYAFATGLLGNPNGTFMMVDPYRSHNIDMFTDMCQRRESR